MRSLSGRQSFGRWPPLWPVGAILAAYAVPLLIVPSTLGLPLIDDWSYQRSVARLVEDGELWVAPWTATTLVLQIGWGALFALPFGAGPVVLRGSTLVASFGGTLAAYALYRALGATKGRAVIGALAVWFNPIGFGLSYTFMTEVPYLALLTAAAWATVRAAGRGPLPCLPCGCVDVSSLRVTRVPLFRAATSTACVRTWCPIYLHGRVDDHGAVPAYRSTSAPATHHPLHAPRWPPAASQATPWECRRPPTATIASDPRARWWGGRPVEWQAPRRVSDFPKFLDQAGLSVRASAAAGSQPAPP